MGYRHVSTSQIDAKMVQEHLRLAAAKPAPLVERETQRPLPRGRMRRLLRRGLGIDGVAFNV
jgi:hypothetical protein